MNYYEKYLKYKKKYYLLKKIMNQKGGDLWTYNHLNLDENDGEKLFDYFCHIDRHGKIIDYDITKEISPFKIPDNIILGLNESCGCMLTESTVTFYNPLSTNYLEKKIMNKNDFILKLNLDYLIVEGGKYIILKPGSTICNYELGNNGKFYDFTNGIAFTKFGSNIDEIYHPLEFYNDDITLNFTPDIIKRQLIYICQYLLDFKIQNFTRDLDIRFQINEIKESIRSSGRTLFNTLPNEELMENARLTIGIIDHYGFMDLLEKHKYFSFYKNFLLRIPLAQTNEEVCFIALIETLLYIDKYRPPYEIAKNFKANDINKINFIRKQEIALNPNLWNQYLIIKNKTKTDAERETAWKTFLDESRLSRENLWEVNDQDHYELKLTPAEKKRDDLSLLEKYYFIIFIQRKNEIREDNFYLSDYLNDISSVFNKNYPGKLLYVHLNSCQGGSNACLVNNCYKLMLSSNYDDNFTSLNEILRSLTFTQTFEGNTFNLKFNEENNSPILTFSPHKYDSFKNYFREVFVKQSNLIYDVSDSNFDRNINDDGIYNIVSLLYLFMEISVTFNPDNEIELFYPEYRQSFKQFDKLLKSNGHVISTLLISKFYKYQNNREMINLILYVLNNNYQYRINILRDFINFLKLFDSHFIKDNKIKKDIVNFEEKIRVWLYRFDNYEKMEKFFTYLYKNRISISVYNNYSVKYFFDEILTSIIDGTKVLKFRTGASKSEIRRDSGKDIFNTYYENMDVILNLKGVDSVYNFNYKLKDLSITGKDEEQQIKCKNKIKELLLRGLIDSNSSYGSYITLQLNYDDRFVDVLPTGFYPKPEDRDAGGGTKGTDWSWDDSPY